VPRAAEPGTEVVHAQRARARTALASIEPRPGRLDRAIRVGVRAGFLLVGWRVRVEGLERLPRMPDGTVAPCVLAVAPHRGWIDPFVLLLAWPADAPRLT
jgi:1-acyl-sn-glycerol-3-phosphate acyltransferase